MEPKNSNPKHIRLRDARLSELGRVSFSEWGSVCARTVTLLGASIAAGVLSGSFLAGVGAFCALRYIGLKIDQASR
ncbi:hypothetical protein [Ralstonia solanacearum]|uniref:hypothetical protein n=1 Tax=Ralstonia solanacearum TaxID=305 RepID=UPI0005AC8E15|nr:hypothetical protein [Ralstonia solanacearum]MDC6177142.1 hypothetical protein [Ralstonia solanacearum]MDC6238326.1 hypothetical protein [Ralstonia solanacearum]